MTLTHEPVVDEERAAPPRRKRWPWLVAVIVVVVLAMAGGVWWLLDSTVPVGDYDGVVAELDATEAALASAEEELAMAEAEVAALQSEVEALAAENTEMAQDLAAAQRAAAAFPDVATLQEAIGSAVAAAEAFATLLLDLDREFAIEVQDAGADVTLADDLLADLGRSETFVDWAVEQSAGMPWFFRDESMADVDDDVLFQSYSTWLYAELGSLEELASRWEYQWRLAHLILEPLHEMQLLVEDLAATTPTA